MPLDSLRPGSGIARLFLGRQDQAGTGAEAAEQVEDRQIEVQRSDAFTRSRSSSASMVLIAAAWLTSTPLGTPVEPEV